MRSQVKVVFFWAALIFSTVFLWLAVTQGRVRAGGAHVTAAEHVQTGLCALAGFGVYALLFNPTRKNSIVVVSTLAGSYLVWWALKCCYL